MTIILCKCSETTIIGRVKKNKKKTLKLLFPATIWMTIVQCKATLP